MNDKEVNKIFKGFFTYDELKCKCGCEKFEGKEIFMKKFLLFRVIYDTSFSPTSCYRCTNHQQYSSNHAGYAADIPYNEGNSTQRMKIVRSAILADFNRIGIAKNFIHIDCNPIHNISNLKEALWFYPGI